MTNTLSCVLIGNGAEPGEVAISTVQPGYRFVLVFCNGKQLPGTVVKHGMGSTTVLLDGLEHERGPQHWSLDTAVRRIDGQRGLATLHQALSHKSKGDTNMTVSNAVEKTASLLGGSTKKATRTKKGPRLLKTREKTAATAKAPKVAKVLNSCKCGCGEKVTGNFRQGHDARYFGLLKKVVREILPFNQLPKAMQNEAENVAGCKRLLGKH